MGSCSNYSALERYVEEHGSEDKLEYEKMLLGKKVVELLEVEVDYYIMGDVKLDDNSTYTTHYRWATEEEDACGEELPEESDSIPMKEYYEENIIGKEITKIEIGFDRDDTVYCYAYVGNPDDCICIEIPITTIYEIEDEIEDEDNSEE